MFVKFQNKRTCKNTASKTILFTNHSMAVTRAFSVSVIILLFYVICGEKLLTLTWKNTETRSCYEIVNNECLVDNHCLNFVNNVMMGSAILDMSKQEFGNFWLLNSLITQILWHVFSLDDSYYHVGMLSQILVRLQTVLRVLFVIERLPEITAL